MKKNLLTVLILALLVVNLVLTTIMMVSVLSANKKTSELVTSIATVLNIQYSTPGSGDEAETVSLADTETHSLGEQMIPLTTADGKTIYMIFEMSLSMNTKGDGYKKLGEGVSSGNYDSLIADQVNLIVSAHTAEECQTNFEPIRAEILKAVQDLIGQFVYRINISGIKFG